MGARDGIPSDIGNGRYFVDNDQNVADMGAREGLTPFPFLLA
jgi:hypothetical protein